MFGGREGRLFQSSSEENKSKLHLLSNLLNPSRGFFPTGLQKHFPDMMRPVTECTGLQRMLWPTLFLPHLILFACHSHWLRESHGIGLLQQRSLGSLPTGARSQVGKTEASCLHPTTGNILTSIFLGVRGAFCFYYFSLYLHKTDDLKKWGAMQYFKLWNSTSF